MPTVPTITLVTTMIHEIPRGRRVEGAPEAVVLSASPITLNVATDRFIREEMLQPSFAGGREILFGTDLGSPVPQLAAEIFNDHDLLPEHSRQIATHLHKVQSGSGSAGVFLTAIAEAGGLTRLVIMKAEHQEGVRLRQTLDEGEVAFEVEHLQELILGRASRVYKIALLWIEPSTDRLIGLMVDRQNGAAYADYFLDLFLGFQLVHQAEVLTKDFVDGLTKFINSSDVPEEKRLRYSTAAVAVLESPQPRVNTAQFITDFIDREDRDTLKNLLPASVASMDFRKDTTLVRAQIGGLKLSTDTGVTVQASQEALANGTVRVEPDAEGGPRIVVQGETGRFDLSTPPRKR